MEAAGTLREAYDALNSALDEHKGAVEDALSTLREIQGEYEEWKDNIEERFSGTATYDLLTEIVDSLEIPEEVSWDNMEEIERCAEEADQVTLPAGFGRD